MGIEKKIFAGLVVFGAILLSAAAAAAAGEGVVQGSVGLVIGARQFVPGSHVRLYLVTEPVAVTEEIDMDHIEKFKKVAYLNERHVDFFLRVREKITQPGYVKADTLSTDNGSFRFDGVPPGRYYILVTFPTIIHGHKVAWQVPIELADGERVSVDLRNFNMALPSASRY